LAAVLCCARVFVGNPALGAERPSTDEQASDAKDSGGDEGAAAETSAGPAATRESACPPATRRHSYAWQTLATDGAGIGFVILGGALKFEGPAAITAASIGATSLLLGGPIVHVAHGRWPIGVLDFGLRVSLPLIGGYIASAAQDCRGECGGPLLVGLLIGVAPIWIDAGLLAWEDVPLDGAPRASAHVLPRSLARLGVTELHPTAQATRRGFEFGLGGSF
jgi:hypothetical protein